MDYDELENLSLAELHKRAYEARDREDNYNYGTEISEPFDEDAGQYNYEIEDEVKNPYDYGSPEYQEAIDKIMEKRNQYRASRLMMTKHFDRSR